ncbi:Copper chaperone CopZ [Cellulomonas sp. T2.31MG-18]|jgi:copper chaperone CopZ|uniref:heavy-metal-associated domain-containing protein n=1 Tax=Cellulomonas sp. T2.31MG-18 TaxID=3157619 RepID=UPI0035E973AB
MSTTTYLVQGMTCGHCVGSVSREVGRLAGVTGVDIELVPDGVTTVTVRSAAPLDTTRVAAAVAEAGYELTGALS